MSNVTERQYPPREDTQGLSIGTILFGVILLALGVLWLLDAAGAIDVTWTFVGAVMLVLIGVALLIGAREGSHGGMIFVGLVLTVVVLAGSFITVPAFWNGVGERETVPETFEAVEESYNWGVGSQRIDFREVAFPEGETEISVQLGTGELLIFVPSDIGVDVSWRVGMGEAQVLDREHSGIGLNGDHQTANYDEQERQLRLSIQLGMGSVEVLQ